jgi:Raf kinase inhibitor-like YbhB/YbcL family protein
MTTMPAFALRSPAFEDGKPIPRRHTCQGDDVAPAIGWTPPPAGTRSLALVVEDPDAPRGTFTHWLAWGIPPDAPGLAEGRLPPREGRNDFGEAGWRGPCPPRGHGPHRYVFRLVALDTTLDDLAPGAGARDVDEAVDGHVLAAAELTGTFER